MADTVNYGFVSSRETLEENSHIETGAKRPVYTETTQLTGEEKRKEKRSIYLSLAGLCLCITGVTSAFDAMFNSQTSLLPVDNLGNTSITVGSGMTIVSAAFLTSYLIQLAGIKKAMLGAMIGITLYIAAYFYPKLAVIVVFAALSGIAFSCMMTAWFSYGNCAAHWYHKHFGGDLSLTVTLIAGIINMSANSGFLWGNVLLYFILDEGQTTNSTTSTAVCGAQFCNEDLYNSTNAKPPSDKKYYTLIGVFTCISIAGCIGTLFIANIPEKLQQDQAKTKKNLTDFWKVLLESWYVFKQPKGFLTTFLILFIGMEQAFTASVFTQAFIACNAGVSKVGFIMFTYGISEMIISAAQWLLIKTLGRPLLIVIIYFVYMGCYIFLLTSNAFQLLPYFIVATLFGMGDATLLSTIFALYGYLFADHTEGAYSLISLWTGIGTFVPFLTNSYMCVNVKLYILIGFGTLAFSTYLGLELMLYLQAKRKPK